ncbi:MAG: IS1182 family transposase [Dehalococcoidia bacterium]
MNKTYRPYQPDQPVLLPLSLGDYLPDGDLAYFIPEMVAELDLAAIFAPYERERRGYPPYHPQMLVGLLLYAYARGVYSSRRIALACSDSVGFMVVTARQTPDFRTIAAFRKRHLATLAGLFGQVLKLAGEAGLVKLGHVALDGTKVHANASRHKALSYGRMEERASAFEAAVAAWLQQAEETDAAEDAALGDRQGDELPAHLATKEKRAVAIRKAKAALEERARAQAKAEGSDPEQAIVPPKTQYNFTDPESRIMKTPLGFEQCYNAQAAVDADSLVIVGQEVTASPTDVQRLEPTLETVKEETGRYPDQVSADAGYASETNLLHLEDAGIDAYVALGRLKHDAPPAAVPESALRTGRLSARARMREKLGTEAGRAAYAKRKQTVEPVFGHIKACRGFRQFLLRGLGAVQGEWALLCTVHNLLRLYHHGSTTN